MKTLKILLAVCVLCFVNNTQGQSDKFAEFVNMTQRKDISKFTKSDWEAFGALWSAIKINGVSWRKVEDTRARADEVKIKKLFGNDMKKGSLRGGELDYFNSEKKGLSLTFYVDNDYYFERFEIANKNSNINILGVTLTIGDSINKLKNVKINYKHNFISFSYGDAGALFIEFDPSNKKITKIYYTTWT